MSDAKWTPGPWHRVHATIYPENFRTAAEGMTPIASIRLRPRARTLTPREEATGDIIAAAPDLYAALDRMLRAFEGPGETTFPACAAARAALAKARGEPWP